MCVTFHVGCVTGTTRRGRRYNCRFNECFRVLWLLNILPATHEPKQLTKYQEGMPLPLFLNTSLSIKSIGDEMICVVTPSCITRAKSPFPHIE